MIIKFSDNLTKIERTRQCLEEELFYMEKEMKELGLEKTKKDSNKRMSTQIISEQQQQQQRSSIYHDYDIERKSSLDLDSVSVHQKSLVKSQSDLMYPKKYIRKGNSLVHFSHEPLHYTPKIRKFSLGNNPMSFFKARSSSIYSSESSMLAKNSISSDGSVFGEFSTSPTPSHMPANSDLVSVSVINKNIEPVFSPRILQLPKVDQIYADRRKKSRKVSFTQVDLNELEIPKTYMHSNEALEKYKFNPNYYLQDGTLKTKFLLPQLKDSLETIKNCRYIRQYSIDGGQPAKNDQDIVKYIFHDSSDSPPTIN